MLSFFKNILSKRNKKYLDDLIVNTYRNDCLLFCDSISEHLKELNVYRAVMMLPKKDGCIDSSDWENKKLSFIHRLNYTSLQTDGYNGLSFSEQSELIDKCLDEHLRTPSVHNGNEKFINGPLYRYYLKGILLQLGWEVNDSENALPMFIVCNKQVGGAFFYEFKSHLINEDYLNRLLMFSKKLYGREKILIVSPTINRKLLNKFMANVFYLHHNRLHELDNYIIHTT